MDDTFNLTGSLRIELRDEQGALLREHSTHNLIVLAGKALAASRLGSNGANFLSHMAIGSGSSAPGVGQTALDTQTAIVALSSSTPASNQLTMVASFGAGVGTGPVAEAGLFNAASAGTMFSRTTDVSLTKGPTDVLTITWTITVN